MKTSELEKKFLLDRQMYEWLYERFSASANICRQINYYYDTEDEAFRQKNITCRIRQKNDVLMGTVKKHGVDGEGSHSIEETFSVTTLPLRFEIGQQAVVLKGMLVTDRIEIALSSELCLVLDKNMYLGETDYELELEYNKNCEDAAEIIMKVFEKVLCAQRRGDFSPSKSERFFRKLENASGRISPRPQIFGYNPDAYLEKEMRKEEV